MICEGCFTSTKSTKTKDIKSRRLWLYSLNWQSKKEKNSSTKLPPDNLLLDKSPNTGPLISRWELDKFKNCWNKSFRTSKILTLLYQQFSNLLIFQRDMSGPRLGALTNNRWSGVSFTLDRSEHSGSLNSNKRWHWSDFQFTIRRGLITKNISTCKFSVYYMRG